MEETHYYPFGLTMAGISSKALKTNYAENKYLYNGIELDTALGLDYYEARFRNYDPQIGRFAQIDPKVESAEGWSVYSGMLDNPILNSDPLGDSSIIGNWLDSRGWGFREPTSEQWEDHPVKSAITEVGYVFADFFGLTQVENTARTVSDPDVSTTDKVVALASLGPATTKGEGGPGEILVEKPAVKVEMKAPGTDATQVTKAYSRPNNATTPAQRSSVQGKACSTCGATGGKMVADHKNPLVKEHYETGSINKKNMRSVDAAQPQCTTCSAQQGGKLKKYSMEQKKKNGL